MKRGSQPLRCELEQSGGAGVAARSLPSKVRDRLQTTPGRAAREQRHVPRCSGGPGGQKGVGQTRTWQLSGGRCCARIGLGTSLVTRAVKNCAIRVAFPFPRHPLVYFFFWSFFASLFFAVVVVVQGNELFRVVWF